ncbi:hypothetical protein Q4029_03385 [Acinetobacter baumannii]|uniref:Uncharacterized protein n=2 Tax=Acinetobacter baumannii TaxID=470 RepID=A0A090B229_ACIBA|nr:hypothetical protein [Acinetobacter baumannii]EKU2422615.1 hypothetical protein [Acinetobacter baumannii]EKV1719702.1 hypothetical protein [Acinetobacter baumannii]EKX2702435.1 hypothetical protein [Acinetobacter baumannii]EKX9477912.1 hypothetical protein [Acinetobacter baumannii]EKY1322300.1 hypothetical protein [Acinetobacter baumannii]
MNSINRSSKFFLAVFLMMSLSNTYAAKIQVEEVDAMEAAGAEVAKAGGADVSGMNGQCRVDEACDAVTSLAPVSEDEMYGGIEQEYVVKGCKVTVYNDGPVKMVDVKTDQPCDAPLPKGHKFTKKNH